MSDADAERRWRASASPLGNRSDYKATWDRQAQDAATAALAVAGHTDEAEWARSAQATLDTLASTVGIEPHDVTLEIGCGIGRVGAVLAPRCAHWFGADISGRMIHFAGERLRGIPNVTLLELAGGGLPEFPDESFDLVYCTIVFMHLLEWDRFRYVQEAFRVLRPGGRLYFDNAGLETSLGWDLFTAGASHVPASRPAHISMTSTREEFGVYLRRSGFAGAEVLELPNGLIAGIGRRP